MGKPSIIAAGIVIVLCIGLIAIEAAGLGLFLNQYELIDLDFEAAGRLVGQFTPFASVLILLIAIITICVVSPTYPNQQGRVCVGCCWAFIAVLCVACAILSVLGFILDALAGINCDNDVFKVVPDLKSECEDITTIGKYLSIASAGVFFVTFLLSICLCCFGCFCQSCDEPGREDTVTFVRGGRIV